MRIIDHFVAGGPVGGANSTQKVDIHFFNDSVAKSGLPESVLAGPSRLSAGLVYLEME